MAPWQNAVSGCATHKFGLKLLCNFGMFKQVWPIWICFADPNYSAMCCGLTSGIGVFIQNFHSHFLQYICFPYPLFVCMLIFWQWITVSHGKLKFFPCVWFCLCCLLCVCMNKYFYFPPIKQLLLQKSDNWSFVMCYTTLRWLLIIIDILKYNLLNFVSKLITDN